MATRRNTRLVQPTKPLMPGGNKRPLEGDDQNPKKKRVFGDITNRDNVTANQKKAIKREVVTKKGKTKTMLAIPKDTKVKKVTKKEEPEGLPLSQTSVKSGDVSWDILELSLESKSSQGSNTSDPEVLDKYQDLVLSEAARKFLQSTDGKFDDIDLELINDPFQCSLYSHYIFNYYKEREAMFVITDYMPRQPTLTAHMRGILVDWLVEVQENFELNHETLYLAIKLVDLYLHANQTPKEKLQLVGATALFIACKFDERCPPMLDDFLYICDDAYKREELIRMEMKLLRAINFDLGVPLSYRFLRRYSKCARSGLKTLTLARYILETSQMDYSFVQLSDSLRAAAALLLAMMMDNTGSWNTTLVYYTGYTEDDIMPLVKKLNTMIRAQPKSKLSTIRVKYSHKVFHEVAKTAPLDLTVSDSPSKENADSPS